MTGDMTEARLRAALAALGVPVPAGLWQADHADSGLRRAALWALLWRTAGAGMAEAASDGSDDGSDKVYYIGPHEWPVPEDQAQRARAEIQFAAMRVEAVADTVAPWSTAVETGDEDEPVVDGWATTAGFAAEAAAHLLGPLACRRSSVSGDAQFALDVASHNLEQAVTYLGRLAEACGRHPERTE